MHSGDAQNTLVAAISTKQLTSTIKATTKNPKQIYKAEHETRNFSFLILFLYAFSNAYMLAWIMNKSHFSFSRFGVTVVTPFHPYYTFA